MPTVPNSTSAASSPTNLSQSPTLADKTPENDIDRSSQHVKVDSSSTSWYTVPSSTPSPTPSDFFESLLISLTPSAPSALLPQPPLATETRPSATRGPRVGGSPPHDEHLPTTCIYAHSRHDRRPRSPPNQIYERESESRLSSQESTPPFPPRRKSKSSRHHHTRYDRGPVSDHRDHVPTIERKTLVGLPPWPPGLQLSLIAGNWQEWSQCLLRLLAIEQLDEYPLGLLHCPDERAEPLGYRYWKGNDRVILAYMRWQMSSAEGHHIATSATSAEAFQVLLVRHEKRSRFTQLQLIQKLTQISFGDNPESIDTAMTTIRDLVYRIESIGPIDMSYLCLFFLWQNLKTSHPTVHDALTPAILDGSITVELLEAHMQYYFETRASAAYLNQTFAPFSSVSLPAQLPPQTMLCPNCKQSGHTIKFCVAPGGKTDGLPMFDAMTRQPAASHQRTRPQEGRSAQSSGDLLKSDYDGTLWIGGVRYHPVNKTSATVSESPESQLTTPEFSDWPHRNSDTVLDTDTILVASTGGLSGTALLSCPSELPFSLDSGSSSHISCMRSDFIGLTRLSGPRRVSGVGNTSVYASAVGIGTIELLLPETNTRLRLHNALYAPDANVRLVSISQLDRLGYSMRFRAGHCQLAGGNNTVIAVCTPGPSNLYALSNVQIVSAEVALPTHQNIPNLKT